MPQPLASTFHHSLIRVLVHPLLYWLHYCSILLKFKWLIIFEWLHLITLFIRMSEHSEYCNNTHCISKQSHISWINFIGLICRLKNLRITNWFSFSYNLISVNEQQPRLFEKLFQVSLTLSLCLTMDKRCATSLLTLLF